MRILAQCRQEKHLMPPIQIIQHFICGLRKVQGIFLKCTGPFSSKTPLQHDATTSMFHSCDCGVRIKSLTFFPPYIMLITVAKRFIFCFILQKAVDLLQTSVFYTSLKIGASSSHPSLSGNGYVGLY